MPTINYITEIGAYAQSALWGIAVDAARIYVCDITSKKIDVYNRSDYSFVSSISLEAIVPNYLFVDDNYIYASTSDSSARIKIYDKASPHNLVGSFGTTGSNSDQIGGAGAAICVRDKVYLADYSNNKVVMFSKTAPYDYVNSFGSKGIGGGQFSGISSIWVPFDDLTKIYTLEVAAGSKSYGSTVGETNLYSGSVTAVSQSFASGSNWGLPVTGCRFRLRKIGNPPGTLTAKLYDHTGTYGTSSVPTGSPLATSIAVNASELPVDADLVSFVFEAPYFLSSVTNYCLVLEYSSGDVDNCVVVATKTGSAGNYASYSSSSWTPDSSKDLIYAYVAGVPRVQIFDNAYQYVGQFNDVPSGHFFGSWSRNGIVVDSERIYTAGGRTEYLLTFLKNSPYTFEASYPAPTTEATTLAVQGDKIYVTDAIAGKIIILQLVEGGGKGLINGFESPLLEGVLAR